MKRVAHAITALMGKTRNGMATSDRTTINIKFFSFKLMKIPRWNNAKKNNKTQNQKKKHCNFVEIIPSVTIRKLKLLFWSKLTNLPIFSNLLELIERLFPKPLTEMTFSLTFYRIFQFDAQWLKWIDSKRSWHILIFIFRCLDSRRTVLQTIFWSGNKHHGDGQIVNSKRNFLIQKKHTDWCR